MEKKRILVWDLPTRAFHWLLAVSFAGAFLTAESERYRDIHVTLGYTMLGLIAFRLLWGLVGTRYARFSSFPLGLRNVMRYFRSLLTRSPQHYPGHNPAGSWAIYAMLAMVILVGATGYAAYNEIGGEWLAELHEGTASAMLGLVLIHIGAVILSSLIHRENLVGAMLSGYKQGRLRDGIRTKHTFVAAVLLLATLGYWAGGADLLPAPWGGAPDTASVRQHKTNGEHG